MTFTSNTSVPGVGTVRDDDVVTYDPSTGLWALYFDGSDVGIGGTDIVAMHVRGDGSIIMSFNSSSFSVPGLTGGPSGTTVEDSDLILFTPSTTGSSTTGSFSFLLDGSDIGLTSNSEDIDAVWEAPNGDLYVSTLGSVSVSGASGADEDVMRLSNPTLGSSSSGTWSRHYDGSDVGFGGSSSDDMNATSFFANGDMLFSTVGTYSGAGSTGADEDLSTFSGTFGSSTSGSASLTLNLSTLGISTGEDLDGVTLIE